MSTLSVGPDLRWICELRVKFCFDSGVFQAHFGAAKEGMFRNCDNSGGTIFSRGKSEIMDCFASHQITGMPISEPPAG